MDTVDPTTTPAGDFPGYVALIMKAETEGLDSWAEACHYADALVRTGLVNSTGSFQRFVRDMAQQGWTLGVVPCIVDPDVDGPTFDDCMCPHCAAMAADHPTVEDAID
jgi:hypothetical protein